MRTAISVVYAPALPGVNKHLDGPGRPSACNTGVKSIVHIEYDAWACSPPDKMKRTPQSYPCAGKVYRTTSTHDCSGRMLTMAPPDAANDTHQSKE